MFAKLKQFQEEREEGFTLIELLVVILIIGILSAIAIPAFLNQRKSAVDSSVQSDVSNAAKQIETFVVKSGSTSKALDSAGTGIKDIKVSDGTTLKITGNTFGYTIVGTNTGGDTSNPTGAAKGFVYVSDKGGIQKDTAAATAIAAAAAIPAAQTITATGSAAPTGTTSPAPVIP